MDTVHTKSCNVKSKAKKQNFLRERTSNTRRVSKVDGDDCLRTRIMTQTTKRSCKSEIDTHISKNYEAVRETSNDNNIVSDVEKMTYCNISD